MMCPDALNVENAGIGKMPDIYIIQPLYFENYFVASPLSEIETFWFNRTFNLIEKHLKTKSVYPCRIESNIEVGIVLKKVIDNGVEEIDIYDTEQIYDQKFWYVETGNESREIIKSLKNAEKEFNEIVMDDISKIINTENRDLPLLIGQIKDKGALKLFNRLLLKG